MRMVIACLVLLAAAACGAPSSPQAAPTNGIEIRDAWASPTPGGITVSAGYMTIVNHGAAEDRLIGATSERANSVDVHSMSMDGGMMTMRPAGELPIPAGGTLTLAPGGLHLMFTNVATPFKEGESVPLTLHFEHGGDVETTLPVERRAS